MKDFNDLEFRAPHERLLAFIERVTERLRPQWNRHAKFEKERGVADHDEWKLFGFLRANDPAEPQLSRVGLCLAYKKGNKNVLYVSNIVPQAGELTYGQYNKALREFADLSSPIADELGVEMTYLDKSWKIEERLTDEAMSVLTRFSRTANRATSGSHPSDRELWLEFLVLCHLGRKGLEAYELNRWLLEEEGWEDHPAAELAIEFEFALQLLRHYDGHRN